MGFDMKSILEKATEAAKNSLSKEIKKAAAAEAELGKSRLESWKRSVETRESQERDAKAKEGMTLVESFLADISGSYLRMMSRDGASSLQGAKIILRPGKSDASPDFSFQVEFHGGKPQYWHRPNIEQMSDLQNHLISRLKEKGVASSSSVEMMEEILRLRARLSDVSKIANSSDEDKLSKIKDLTAPF